MIYIMRHGKTNWNKEYRLQGRTDIPLNDEGRAMAERAGELFKEVHFDVCYCSPLSRARETAEIFLRDREDLPIIVDDRLIEMSFGICEGEDHVISNPDSGVYLLFNDPENYKPVEGAESFEQLYSRTGDFYKHVAKPLSDSGKNVLIIGHGAMNTSIICQARNIPLRDFWTVGIENCKLIEL